MNSSHRNQQRRALPWRDEAMNESLRGEFRRDLQTLLAAICRARPDYTIQMAAPDYEPMINFLRSLGPLRSLLLSTCSTAFNYDAAEFYTGWFAVEWQGATLEVALVPAVNTNKIICMSRDEEKLNSFTRALLDFALRPVGRCLRYSEGWENATDIDKEIGKVTWDDIVLPPKVLNSLRLSIEGFFENREAVRDFGFAWKRGILLVGPPGTGKTMVCKAAAAALPELPFLYVRDLREDDQKESIQAIFERARKLAPCILAFEDIDGFITDSNRTVFLNEMDGFADNEGLLVIASSNHPGKIDEALLKRPSRFDRVFHLGLPAEAERRTFCERTLERSTLASKLAPELDIVDLCTRVAAKSEGFTPAYLKEALISAALERAQAGATMLDEDFTRQVLEQVDELRAHMKKLKNPDALGEMRSLDDVIGFRR
jgi:ATP-dependent 26S proteasome regulatory subunit